MSIYNINFGNEVEKLLPPAKREPKNLAWLRSLVKPIQWLRDLFFEDYANGNNDALYDSLATYSVGDRVRYMNKIYECISNTTAGTNPSNITNWIKILDDFRGARERVTYNGQKIVLEWILNRWFGTSFIQPDSTNPTNRSDFYVDTQNTDDDSFLVGETSPETSFVSETTIFMEDFVGESYDPEAINFIVYYPLATIPSTTDDKYYQMTALTEKYKLAGTTPGYESY